VLLDRYRLPRPRSVLAPAIAAFAHSAIDVSDGLAADFTHLCRASQVKGEISVAKVPLSAATRRILTAEPGRLSDVLGGGDDYEVLLTAPAKSASGLHSAAGAAGILLTEIGRIVDQSETGEAVLVDVDGRPVILKKAGWTHV
jgi:thiamine-monophosphate kinase